MLNAGSIIKCCEINGIRNDNKYIDDINCMKEEEYDMRHLIDPKDLSVEETGIYLHWQKEYVIICQHIVKWLRERR